MCGRRAFTLIELLVVIAIVAILAAILFPVFVRVRARGWLTTCVNNQKQLTLALLSYMDDNNGRFPWAGASKAYAHDARRPPFGIGGSAVCFDAIKKYSAKAEGIRWCRLQVGKLRSAGYTKDQFGWSYWYFCPHNNPYVAGYNGGRSALCGYSMSDVRFPSRKPVITEIWEFLHQDDDTRFIMPVAYCDGHVRQLLQAYGHNELTKLYVGRDGTYDGVYQP